MGMACTSPHTALRGRQSAIGESVAIWRYGFSQIAYTSGKNKKIKEAQAIPNITDRPF